MNIEFVKIEDVGILKRVERDGSLRSADRVYVLVNGLHIILEIEKEDSFIYRYIRFSLRENLISLRRKNTGEMEILEFDIPRYTKGDKKTSGSFDKNVRFEFFLARSGIGNIDSLYSIIEEIYSLFCKFKEEEKRKEEEFRQKREEERLQYLQMQREKDYQKFIDNHPNRAKDKLERKRLKEWKRKKKREYLGRL